MDFYLDFEATRFSNRIISVGCSAKNGNTFSSLVKPPKGDKVDKFIAELTGITNEMLVEAPSANEVFSSLFDFIMANGDGLPTVYYVYGNCDIDFLKATLKHMDDPKACMCVQAMIGGLVDYAPTVRKFFSANGDLALRKVYMLIKSYTEMEQKHDALEDAKMLQTIVENLHKVCKPEDKVILNAIPSQKLKVKPTPGPDSVEVPSYFLEWNAGTKKEAKTFANENDWKYRGINDDGEVLYFNDITVAAMYIIKFSGKKLSPKKKNDITKVIHAINCNTQIQSPNKCKAYGYYWTRNAQGGK